MRMPAEWAPHERTIVCWPARESMWQEAFADAKVRLSVPRSHFNELAKEGKIRHWREAFESGHVKATGPAEILKLIQSVIERQEERSRTRKLRTK